MASINFLPAAQDDFDQAYDWYAERSPIAAERFAQALDVALARIAWNPQALAFADRAHQFCPVKRFPFRVVFRVLDDQIQIVAIVHAKRRPNYWLRKET